MKTKTVFCANCQAETPHEISLANDEVIFTCTTEGCERFIKVPASMDKKELADHLKAHKETNQGQVSKERYEQAEQDLIDALSD
jgi:hypothetical protein